MRLPLLPVSITIAADELFACTSDALLDELIIQKFAEKGLVFPCAVGEMRRAENYRESTVVLTWIPPAASTAASGGAEGQCAEHSLPDAP